jgi:hypothetical protein
VIANLQRAILDAPKLQAHLAAVSTEKREPLAEERDFHEGFIESRTRIYVRRKKLRNELAEYVKSDSPKVCLVVGPSGSGKSAALARFVRVWKRARRDDIFVFHFVGASPRSTDLREMLRHLCAELKDALNLEGDFKQDVREPSIWIAESCSKTDRGVSPGALRRSL